MSNTSDQTTKPSKTTRLIVGEVGVDTETGIVGKGHSYDNGKTFVVDDTIYGRIYHADDHGKIWKGIQDQVAKVVAPAKSAADSAVSAADAAVASAQVTSDAVTAIASATAEAKQGANEAMSRAKSAWDVATGAKSAVTDFDPLLKSAQSDASKALTQITATASALSDTKTAFGSDVATAKELASTAQTTADSAVAVASDARSNATVAIQTASGASLTAINAQGDATIAKQTASEAAVQASNAESDFAQLSIRANKIEANVANNSGAIASVQQTANGLTTTVADIKANGGGVNLANGTTSEDQSFGNPSQTTGWQITTIATFDNPQAGQEYTISVNTKTNGGSWRIQIWDGTSPTQRGNEVYGEPPVVAQEQKHIATITWPSGSNKYLLVQLVNNNDGGQIVWNSAMIEEGKVAHTWSPAPDDLQAQFTQIKTSINGVTTTINDPKTGLNATYQTAAGNATTISSVKGDVTQLQATANGLTSRVGSLESKTDKQQTAIEQNKTAIALKADETTVDTLKGTVNQNTATLKTQSDQIQSKVSASDVTGMLTGYATQSYTQSLVTQTADKWNLNITELKTDVNAIKTTGGGVNLANGTTSKDQSFGDASQKTGWQIPTIATIANPKAGQQYTISVNMKANGGSWRMQIWDGTSTTQRGNEVYGEPSLLTQVTAQEQKHSTTITWPSGSNKYLLVQLVNNNDGGQITWNSAMIEEGSVAHTWSPAPSDMATVTSVANLSATVNGIQSQVYNSDGSSKITQLSSLIASKVSQGDYNSQITQLKNDINQRVQVGDVISQINQEAGGDTLIQVSNGKKSLILDAGNTIFTGKAWIPDAAIGSISADKVMLGSSSLYNSDGTLNLVNQSNGLKALIQVKQGLVQNTTQSIISFSSDYNNRAFSITPVGATVTPTLFFERYDQTAGHWLGFSRNEVQREGLTFNTWDNDGERFFVSCHARFNKNITAEGTIMQGTWNGTTGKPEAGILSIEAGNTIWSGSDFLAVGDHISNSYTNVIAKSFSQQSTLSSKTNIETVDPKDALDLVNRTDIRSYQYKTDVAQGKTKRYTSLIIDDVNDVSQYYAPDEFTNEERTGRDDGSAVGYLFLAIQELTRRIKTLEEKLNG